MTTTIRGTQEECVRQAISAKAERLADLDTATFLFGDTMLKLTRIDPEPAKGSREWLAWINQTGRQWHFVPVAPEDVEPILRRSMEREVEQARINYEGRLRSVQFRAANPVSPWGQGAMEALIEADRPSGGRR